MFQCLFDFFNEIVPFSTASMASSNVSLVHLPLVIRGLHLLIFFCFLIDFCPKNGGTFSLSWLSSFYNPLFFLRGTLIIMM
jgi:hypothetical protein